MSSRVDRLTPAWDDALLELLDEVERLQRSIPPGKCLDMHPDARKLTAYFLRRYDMLTLEWSRGGSDA